MNQLIDRICDDFEAAWQQGEPLRIETLLLQSDAQSRNDLLDVLLPLEISLRQAAGQRPRIEDYAERFPDHLHLIRSAISISVAGDETVDLKVAQHEITTELESPVPPGTPARTNGSASSPTDNTVRKSVGRYTIVGTLGSGGQADVYRAVHPTLPIEVAIKLTHKRLSGNAREALLEEAHILCDLDHSNIARIRDFDFDDGRPFMVLDFIRGRSLGQIAKSQPPSPVQAAELVAKLSRAIGYAHARGVLHRDLKPDNVVIDESGQPKIIDFGMSRMRSGIAGAADEANEVSGTLAYMSPEQAAGITSNTDHRVDIFALGAILYRLLVGKAPYSDVVFTELLRNVRQGDYDRASLDAADVPEELKAICHRAMHANQAERFSTAERLAESLEQAVSTSQPPPVTQTRSKSRQSVIVAGIVAISMMVLFGLFLPRSRSSVAINVGELPDSPTQSLIKNFELIHIGNSADRAEFSGSFPQRRPPFENDDIQVRADFNEPVYCFLIALNPDGVKQLCYPNDAGLAQAEPITTLRYPDDEDSAFGLTDGSGQQAFVLYTSREPLPAFDAWDSELTHASWPNPDVSGNWLYREGQLQEIASAALSASRETRGAVRETKTPTPFKRMCDRLREEGATDVRGVLFEVQPKP